MGYRAAESAVIEPLDIEDVHVMGVGRVEMLSNGDARIIFFRERNGERVATLALVIAPNAAVTGMAMLTTALTGGSSCDKLGPCLTRVLRLAN